MNSSQRRLQESTVLQLEGLRTCVTPSMHVSCIYADVGFTPAFAYEFVAAIETPTVIY
jgi:hypothetical protein